MNSRRVREGQLYATAERQRPSGNLIVGRVRVCIESNLQSVGTISQQLDLIPGPRVLALVSIPDCYSLVTPGHDGVVGYFADAGPRHMIVSDKRGIHWTYFRRHQRRPDGPVAVSVRQRGRGELHRDGFVLRPGEIVVPPAEILLLADGLGKEKSLSIQFQCKFRVEYVWKCGVYSQYEDAEWDPVNDKLPSIDGFY